MKPSFSILELVIVIIIIGILASTIIVPSGVNKLQLAADTLEKYINFTHSLALKDDKYQPFPENNSTIEQNRSKYWFKQWWQIRFSTFNDENGKTHYWYEIFSDLPSDKESHTYTYNFDGTGHYPDNPKKWYKSIALNPSNNKLMIGHCGVSHYPDCNETDNKLDLTKAFGITRVEYKNFGRSKRLVFDNFGNVFLGEGDKGDAGDINPLDKNERKLLTKIAKIKLYINSDCLQINITPTGEVYKSNCD